MAIQTDVVDVFIRELERLRAEGQSYDCRYSTGTQLLTRIGNWRGKVVVFSDEELDGSSWFQDQSFVINDPVGLREQFDQIQTTRGSEKSSSALDALHKVIAGGRRSSVTEESQSQWSPHATRHIILITDRSCKGSMTYTEGVGGNVADVSNELMEEHIQLTIYAPEFECYEHLSETDKSELCCPADGDSVSSILEDEMRVLAGNLMGGACSPEFAYDPKMNKGWRYEDEIG